MNRNQLKIAAVAIVLGAGLLAGCGKKESSTPATSNSSGSAPTAAAPSSATSMPAAPATSMPDSGTHAPAATTSTPAS
ncbi:hypothetical protein [Acidihalobacter prosperus]|uniref:hypothetical protein n=1 Tax=Acidihalobacter prosperus TaxID=160660 RepID=UPI00137367DD|nr:hypothetical protein [Acidihalobacter prosperus]